MHDAKIKSWCQWLPLSIFLFLGTFSMAAQCTCTDCRCSDSLALVALYDSTNGGNWTNKWTLAQPMTTWYGVALTNGRVTCIDLDGIVSCMGSDGTGNNLVGRIPNKLNDLTQLTDLILNNNQLTGAIPNFNQPNLGVLALAHNRLTGSIPNFNLPNLRNLNLYVNQLTGAIPNLNLPNLGELQLSSNQLTGSIPDFNLPKLRGLYFQYNQLTGTIPNFNSLPNLQFLYLSENRLTGAIPNLNLPNLTELAVANNQLTGSIPNFSLPKLVELHVSNNQLTGTLPNFNLLNLVSLGFFNNGLTGPIPNFNFPNLQYLYASQNQLSGAIPSFNLPSLILLSLNQNQLTGAIPNFTLPSLKVLFLNNNQLSGCIPTGLRSLCPQITTGNITGNPNLINQDWAAFCTNRIGECGLCPAPAPPSVSGITKTSSVINWAIVTGATSYTVEYKTAAATTWTALAPTTALTISLTGLLQGTTYNVRVTTTCATGASTPSVSASFTTLGRAFPVGLLTCLEDDFRELEKLYDATNGDNWTDKTGWFSANMTTWKGISLTNDGCDVAWVLMIGNNLVGTIPNLNLPLLRRLSLRNSQLTGAIPNFNLPNLNELSLSVNQLTGAIPNFNLPNLTDLYLHSNQLTGTIPSFTLPNLQYLWVQQNQLSGAIPDFNFPNLKQLWLQENRLSGCLPASLRSLCPHVTSGNISSNPNLSNQSWTAFCANNTGECGFCPAPSTPSVLSITNTGATINWLAVTGATNYTVEYKTAAATTWTALPITTALTTTLTGLLQGTIYNVRVTTSCTSGASTPSVLAAFSTLIAVLPTQRTDTAICLGKTYTLPNGRVVSSATNYRDTLKTRTGADSLIRLINLTINPLPMPDVRDVSIYPTQTATLQVSNTPNNYRRFQWQNNTSTTASANYTPSVSSTYQVTVTDINGCQGIATATITVKSTKLTPDAITPNGDGKNDRFIIPDLAENPTKYPANELLILNRWGQVLYQAKPYKNDWEGTNQQNQPLPDGTYYYIMRLNIADGKILTGDLLIIRD
jgi:gliding motility-associated-like protein